MSTYDDTRLAGRFRALAPEPFPPKWDEVLEKARGDSRRVRTPLRSRRSRLAVVIAVALIGVIGAASASGTVRGFLPILGKQPSAPIFNRHVKCNGARGNFEIRMALPWTDRSGVTSRRWTIVSGSGQYAEVTGGGRWRSDLVMREGSKLAVFRLWGTITSGGTKQRVLITLEGGGRYTAPGRVNPQRFVLKPLQPGPLKPDAGSQRTDVSG